MYHIKTSGLIKTIKGDEDSALISYRHHQH